MRMKKLVSLLCAAAVTLSAVGGLSAAAAASTPEEMALLSETNETLPAPTNVREENGFIVWDEVPDAYGYTVRTFNGTEEIQRTYYENKAEWKRFIYDYGALDFADYTFDVCAFDESRNNSAWSSKVTVSYAPTIEAPKNIRLGEEQNTVVWDEADGAARYNVRFYNPDGTIYTWTYTWGGSYSFGNLFPTDGEYKIKVQTMDRNYNVSDWSEVTVSYHSISELEAPKNFRYDEENACYRWDPVEGAESYIVDLWYSTDSSSGGPAFNVGSECKVDLNDCLKRISPFAEKSEIAVYAYNGKNGNRSDFLTITVDRSLDESLTIPTEIKYENGTVSWNQNWEEDLSSWIRISTYGRYVSSELGEQWSAWIALPQGTYMVDRVIVGSNGSYNERTDSMTVTTPPDESVWVPKLYYKFDDLIWDWDHLRHENTNSFWLRVSKEDGTVLDLQRLYGNGFGEMKSFENGNYVVEICADDYGNGTYTVGRWSDPLHITIHDGGLFDEENEIETPLPPIPTPEPDRITSIKINPAFNMKNKHDTSVELDLTKIKIKAQEIYDEAGLKRAEEALGAEIIGNKHYNLLDLTLLYNDQDFSNGYDGLVQVIIPLPKGHRDKTFSCYRLIEVDGKMTKEIIPGEQTEDSYIIYLEHFSEYALVADGGETDDHTHTFSTQWKSDSASHWYECACGEKSELSAHTAGEWITESATNYRHRDCTVCGTVLETESLSGGNPSIGRPVTRPTVSTGTTNTENTDNSTNPADPKDEDAEEPEPDETDEEGDVDADTDENDNEEDEDDEDNEPEDDGYDDTFSKDDTDGNDAEKDSPIVTPEAIARDENPGTGVPVNAAMIFGFPMAGAAAYAAFRKDKTARKSEKNG